MFTSYYLKVISYFLSWSCLTWFVTSGVSNRVLDGLYVVDGSILPVAVGVNPTLTISCLAERCMRLLAKREGWKIDYDTFKPLGELTQINCINKCQHKIAFEKNDSTVRSVKKLFFFRKNTFTSLLEKLFLSVSVLLYILLLFVGCCLLFVCLFLSGFKLVAVTFLDAQSFET